MNEFNRDVVLWVRDNLLGVTPPKKKMSLPQPENINWLQILISHTPHDRMMMVQSRAGPVQEITAAVRVPWPGHSTSASGSYILSILSSTLSPKPWRC